MAVAATTQDRGVAADGLRHTAHGYWLEEAGDVTAAPALAGDISADVVVIGGGYAGLWTAWQLRERGATVALLEADVCGHGPSGRNGGFCETLWTHLPSLIERFGAERALETAYASAESVEAIGAWCEAQGVDAWFRRSGYLMVSTAPAHDAILDEVLAVAPTDRVIALDEAAVRARCASPRFRRGIFVPDDATVQPARLALGLRERVMRAGAAVYEHSRVRALRVEGAAPPRGHGASAGVSGGNGASAGVSGGNGASAGVSGGNGASSARRGVVAETAHGRVRAGAAVLAINAATRGFAPLRGRVSVTSSHIVLTEPVPDVVEALNWTGGECITDARTFVHYFRTTLDGRIAFGWGGGRLAPGARLGGRIEIDPEIAGATREHLVRMFPALEGRAITHAWGGPIDVSPSHLPQIGSLDGAPVHYAFGFTGNGVGPCHLAGRVLAALATNEPTPLALVDPAPARVPPEPLAWLGGNLVRRAFIRKERLEEDGRAVDPLTRVIAAAPRALGIHVAR
jgi:glycine/D-amino acid oxidase-like deaminating enzyme